MSAPLPDESFTLTINGQQTQARQGERVLGVAGRLGIEIPTLCEDSRLDPVGCCRMCLVEVGGQRRLQPACTWRAEAGQDVTTESPRIERHRKLLLEMYLADAPPVTDPHPLTPLNEISRLAEAHGALDRFPAACSEREGREDANPYIGFDPELCISCARCVRYCDEVEAVSAITLAGRGAGTTIATAGQIGLLDSTCELCGGCIDTCPTGAMHEKKPLAHTRTDSEVSTVRTTCNFCGVGCQLDIKVQDGRVVQIDSPPAGETLNDGNLCVKGRFAYDFIHHEDRLKTPLVRGADGNLREASWEEALKRAAEGLLGVKERHGADALGFVSSSRCTGEENYLVQKLARAAFGTNNCHSCAAT
ncbi:MAG: (2Fe-2S)-binding protein [Planctomycetes bacterium]|nr:(2Fe-2S)-binding protein [Planctomycetota bacterium]